MGLFDVNMPMLYGEGEKSFVRLQEEIMKESDDQSIFAWVDKDAQPNALYGLLAKSPANFADSGSIIPYYEFAFREPFPTTNRGLRVSLHLTAAGDGVWTAALNCPCPPNYWGFLGIKLKALNPDATLTDQSGSLPQQFARVGTDRLLNCSKLGTLHTLYVRQNNDSYEGVYFENILQLREGPSPVDYAARIQVWHVPETAPPAIAKAGGWLGSMQSTFRFTKQSLPELIVVITFTRRSDASKFALLFGSTRDGVGVDVVPRWDRTIQFHSLKNTFQPRPPGTDMDSGREIVRVDVVHKRYHGRNYYLADVQV